MQNTDSIFTIDAVCSDKCLMTDFTEGQKFVISCANNFSSYFDEEKVVLKLEDNKDRNISIFNFIFYGNGFASPLAEYSNLSFNMYENNWLYSSAIGFSQINVKYIVLINLIVVLLFLVSFSLLLVFYKGSDFVSKIGIFSFVSLIYICFLSSYYLGSWLSSFLKIKTFNILFNYSYSVIFLLLASVFVILISNKIIKRKLFICENINL